MSGEKPSSKTRGSYRPPGVQASVAPHRVGDPEDLSRRRATAIALEAVIGFTDPVSGCDQALATFEVWGEDDLRLFDSGPFSKGMPPRRIRVPLEGATTITLVVTEAGDGPECDEVFLAEPTVTLAH